jgi:serine/threonine-protein kinase
MSPEQASGERKLDARVDIYACGVVMYEAVTGRRPFLAPNYNALLLKIISGTHRRASELLPGLSRGFDAVIERALAVQREDRYANAAEMQRDLLGLRASAVMVPKPPPKSARSSHIQDLDLVTDLDATVLAKRDAPLPAAPPRRQPAEALVERRVDRHDERRLDRHAEPAADSIEIDVTFSESATGPRAAEPEPGFPPPPHAPPPAAESSGDWDEMPTEVFKPQNAEKYVGFRRMPVPFPVQPQPEPHVHRPGIFDDDDEDDDNIPTHLTKRKVNEDMATMQDPTRRPRRK